VITITFLPLSTAPCYLRSGLVGARPSGEMNTRWGNKKVKMTAIPLSVKTGENSEIVSCYSCPKSMPNSHFFWEFLKIPYFENRESII
jgi:hypothetical protein